MTLDHLLAPDTRLEKVASGFAWVEGPAWIPARGVLRFSDIPGNRVVEFSEADGRTAVISDDAEFTNGRTLARDGSVIECSHGRRAVQIDRSASEPGADYAPEILVDRLDPADGSLTTVVIDVEASNGLAFSPDESPVRLGLLPLPGRGGLARWATARPLDPRLRRDRGAPCEERPGAGRGEPGTARRLPRGRRGEPLALLPLRDPGVHPLR